MLIQSKATEPTGAAHDRVYRALRARIMHGEIHPGQAFTLRGIGKEFGVSMTPAREAGRRLVAEGALFLSSSGRVSTPEIERLEEINNRVSGVIARQDASGYIRLNLEFHRTLYLRAQAPAMLAMAETIWLQLGPTMSKLYGRLRRKEPPRNHKLILAALKAGDEGSLKLAVRSDATQGLRMLKV